MRETPVKVTDILPRRHQSKKTLVTFGMFYDKCAESGRDNVSLSFRVELAIIDGKGAEGLLSEGYMWLREGESEI